MNHWPDVCLTQCKSPKPGHRECRRGPPVSRTLTFPGDIAALMQTVCSPSSAQPFDFVLKNLFSPIKKALMRLNHNFSSNPIFSLNSSYLPTLYCGRLQYHLSLNSIMIMAMSIKCVEWVASYLMTVNLASSTRC